MVGQRALQPGGHRRQAVAVGEVGVAALQQRQPVCGLTDRFQPSWGTRTGAAEKRSPCPARRPGRPRPATPRSPRQRSCRPRQTPKVGRPASMRSRSGRREPRGLKLGHGRAEGADAGQHHAVRAAHGRPGRPREQRRGRGPGAAQARQHRGQVGRAGAADDGEFTETPLVLGTPPPSSRRRPHAAPRASALNAASARWWSFSPRSTSTCRRHPRGHGQGLEEVAQVLAGERRPASRGAAPGRSRARAAREVDHRPRQGLVERRVGVAEALDAAALAQRFVKRLSDRQRAVLGRVVVVDLQVAGAVQLQVQAPVAGERREHVVEETQARAHLRRAPAVEGQRAPRSPSRRSCAAILVSET